MLLLFIHEFDVKLYIRQSVFGMAAGASYPYCHLTSRHIDIDDFQSDMPFYAFITFCR